MTARFGTGSGDTATMAASTATYLGTFRASANGQTQFKLGGMAAGGGKGSLLLWNAYNRIDHVSVVKDSTANWTDNGGGAYHAFNAGRPGREPQQPRRVRARAQRGRGRRLAQVQHDVGCERGERARLTGIGLDWTSGGPGGFTAYWESTIIGTFESTATPRFPASASTTCRPSTSVPPPAVRPTSATATPPSICQLRY